MRVRELDGVLLCVTARDEVVDVLEHFNLAAVHVELEKVDPLAFFVVLRSVILVLVLVLLVLLFLLLLLPCCLGEDQDVVEEEQMTRLGLVRRNELVVDVLVHLHVGLADQPPVGIDYGYNLAHVLHEPFLNLEEVGKLDRRLMRLLVVVGHALNLADGLLDQSVVGMLLRGVLEQHLIAV